MSDIVISTENLCKIYRLYTNPRYRFMDMFGLLRRNDGAYTEHAALTNINLTINRGEKVGIIGRNGAGKSTFLKLVCRAIEPTSGVINVTGEIHALLQIGTGFHPDFTGRENIYSYLGNLGVIGQAADEKVEEIIEFSELEEYIDQPIKTYSTGMGVRIMFATSTAIKPDILVLDEVLGVGDAYFANKSFQRMKSLSESQGTTLLLVTHDVYSAASFCDRMIWIDRGQVIFDDDCSEVVKAYEASVRLQEEERLRQRTLNAGCRRETNTNRKLMNVFFQIVPEDRLSMQEKLSFSSIRLRLGNDSLMEIAMQNGICTKGSEYGQLLLAADEGNWGDAYNVDGSWWRDFLPHGSIFHRAPFQFAIPMNGNEARDLLVEVVLNDTCTGKYFIEVYSQDGRTCCLPLGTNGSGEKKTFSYPLTASFSEAGKSRKVFNLLSQKNLALSGQSFGTKQIVIQGIRVEDGHGRETLVFEPQVEMDIFVHLRVINKDYSDIPTLMVVFHKDGLEPAARMICDNVEINNKNGTEKKLKIKLNPLLLGPGIYSITIGVFEPNYFDKCKGLHYASNPMVIDIKRKIVYFEVKTENQLYYRVSYIQPSEWTLGNMPFSA